MVAPSRLDPAIAELVKALARANVARDIELARKQATMQFNTSASGASRSAN